MKKLVKKILTSGLVDKHTAQLMEKWGTLESGSADLVNKELKKMSDKALIDFAEELGELVEKERAKVQETKLSINVGDPTLVTWTKLHLENGASYKVSRNRVLAVFKDEAGNFVFPPTEKPFVSEGSVFMETTSGTTHEVKELVPLYTGDHLYGIQVTPGEPDA